MAQPEFTLIPVFAEHLDNFTIEDESQASGDNAQVVITCDDCLDTVTRLADGLSLRQVMVAVVDHRCDDV